MPPLNLAGPLSTRRASPKRRGPGTGRILARAGKAFVVAGFVAGIVVAWRTGRLEAASTRAWNDWLVVSAAAGFRVEDVEVTGRAQTDRQQLLEALGVQRGDPIFGFSAEEARRRLEGLSWVRSAAVERRLPDSIAITIVERRPIALWQHNERFSLIDADGLSLAQVNLADSPPLPLVVGGDAPAHAAALLALLDPYPALAKRIQAASWIGSRRWDLKLDNGVGIMLPETGAAEALSQLASAEASGRLLERDIVAVDLRLPGRMTVRLAHPPAAVKTKPQQGA